MGSEVENSDLLLQNPEGVYRKEEDGAYLFDPDTGKLKYINRTGADIYDLCDGKTNVGDIIRRFQEQYPEVTTKRIEEDIRGYLEDLIGSTFLQKRAI